jgi:carbon storage regulator
MDDHGCLVLSRKKNERICIGGHLVEVDVVEIRGDKVRLRFKAPKNMSIHRGEVQAAIDSQQAAVA